MAQKNNDNDRRKSGGKKGKGGGLDEIALTEDLEVLAGNDDLLQERNFGSEVGMNDGPSMEDILASLEEILDEDDGDENLFAPLSSPDEDALETSETVAALSGLEEAIQPLTEEDDRAALFPDAGMDGDDMEDLPTVRNAPPPAKPKAPPVEEALDDLPTVRNAPPPARKPAPPPVVDDDDEDVLDVSDLMPAPASAQSDLSDESLEDLTEAMLAGLDDETDAFDLDMDGLEEAAGLMDLDGEPAQEATEEDETGEAQSAPEATEEDEAALPDEPSGTASTHGELESLEQEVEAALNAMEGDEEDEPLDLAGMEEPLDLSGMEMSPEEEGDGEDEPLDLAGMEEPMDLSGMEIGGTEGLSEEAMLAAAAEALDEMDDEEASAAPLAMTDDEDMDDAEAPVPSAPEEEVDLADALAASADLDEAHLDDGGMDPELENALDREVRETLPEDGEGADFESESVDGEVDDASLEEELDGVVSEEMAQDSGEEPGTEGDDAVTTVGGMQIPAGIGITMMPEEPAPAPPAALTPEWVRDLFQDEIRGAVENVVRQIVEEKMPRWIEQSVLAELERIRRGS